MSNRKAHSLDPSHALKEAQERDFFRLSISPTLKFCRVRVPTSFEDNPALKRQTLTRWHDEHGHQMHTARLQDLSGSGLSMATETPLSEGDEIFLEIQRPDLPLRLAGRVVWSNQTPDDDLPAWLIGIEFIGINTRDQDQIVRFLLKQESRRRSSA